MKFKVDGIFQSHNIQSRPSKKNPNESYNVGDAIFKIDNSYEFEGDVIEKKTMVPFNCFGRIADKANDLRVGQKVAIAFELVGREYNGKNYVNVKATALKVEGAVQASASATAPVKSDEEIPW